MKFKFQLGLFTGAMIAAGLLVTGPKLYAQLQQSGGAPSTVTANAGTNLNTSALALDATVAKDATLTTIDTDLKANIVLKAGANVIGKVSIDQTTPGTTNLVSAGQNGTWTVQPGNTVNTTAWFVRAAPATTCGNTAVAQALAAVPTSSTVVFSSTTCLIGLLFENSNAGTQTVTLTDNAGTPLNAVGPAFVVPGLSNVVLDLHGIPFTSGVKWLAGGTGVLGGMIGYQ